MITRVVMPQMGESVVEGKIGRWLVREGDFVTLDQPIVEIATDKVDAEIPSPGAGKLVKILIPEGEIVAVGGQIALIEDGQSETPVIGKSPSAAPEHHPEYHWEAPSLTPTSTSPAVRRLAQEYHVDLSQVPGSGTGGRITTKDILRFLGQAVVLDTPLSPPEDPTPSVKNPAPVPQKVAEERPGKPESAEFSEYQIPRYEPKEGDQVVPFSRLRKIIAEHMVYSKRTAPHVTTVAEADLVRVAHLRDKNKGALKEQFEVDLTFFPFILLATIQALAAHPTLNGSVVGDSLIIRKDVHLGMAVDTPRGLIVPVIRNADKKSLVELAKETSALARKAREGTLSPDDVAGGTFTVTNPGKTGNLFGTPIIFQPQVGILRMGEVKKRPVVIEVEDTDTIAIHPMIYLALSYDHRVIDGATANLFLHRVREVLEEGAFSL